MKTEFRYDYTMPTIGNIKAKAWREFETSTKYLGQSQIIISTSSPKKCQSWLYINPKSCFKFRRMKVQITNNEQNLTNYFINELTLKS